MCHCEDKAKTCDNILGCTDCNPGWTGDQCRDNINECNQTDACPDNSDVCITLSYLTTPQQNCDIVNTRGIYYKKETDLHGYTLFMFGDSWIAL